MNRRALLKRTAAVATAAGLAGCSHLPGTNDADSQPGDGRALDRIVLRADTGNAESVSLTLKYVDPDDGKERPLFGDYTAPEDGSLASITTFDGDPGVYSLTAHSRDHNTVTSRVTQATTDRPVQLEVVVQESGDLWSNVGQAGDDVSIPG